MTTKTKKLIGAEIFLILGSVLIFRGGWLLLDRILLMNETLALWISLFFGIIIIVPTLNYIIKEK